MRFIANYFIIYKKEYPFEANDVASCFPIGFMSCMLMGILCAVKAHNSTP